MSIRIDTYDTDEYATYNVEGVGTGPYTYGIGDDTLIRERNDSFTTHRQTDTLFGDRYGEVVVMVLGTKADLGLGRSGSEHDPDGRNITMEKGYVHAKFTAAQAREIAEALLAAAREADERKAV